MYRKNFILIIIILFFITGCTEKKKSTKEVTFAMLPQMSNAQLFKCCQPILKHLENETGIKITQRFPKDYTEHVKLCREGKIDFAYSNPFTYIQMAPKSRERSDGHKAIAIAVEPHGAVFYGEFIARTDNMSIKEFKDIIGKRGWIVSYMASGGYLYPKGYALDHGIDLPNDCILTESPGSKQEKVIMAVYNRETDFGCVRSGMREKLKGRLDLKQIRVVAETKRYPSWTFSAYDGVDPEVTDKIKQALLKMPAHLFEKAKLPGSVNGFQEAADKDFDSVRTLAEKVKMEY